MNELVKNDDVITSDFDALVENTPENGSFSDDSHQKLVEIIKTIGRIEAFGISRKFDNVMMLVQLDNILMLYRKKDPDVLTIAPRFKDFCQKNGLNYNTIREHLRNLHFFGQEFLEKAEAMSLPLRDMRDLKKLPPEQRETAIQMIMRSDNPDVDSAKFLIRDLAMENNQLKEAGLVEKATLLGDLDDQTNRALLAESHLKDYQAKMKELNSKIKELLVSQKPDARLKAIIDLSCLMSETLDAIKYIKSDTVDDPIMISEIDKLKSLVHSAQVELELL